MPRTNAISILESKGISFQLFDNEVSDDDLKDLINDGYADLI